ncbi:hypothetical protein E4U42_005830 [Claviceps africana]|uniref:Uncharacterized protein n=1 Tax=Claviceps africana TaxID=83212 RepID=A0A8K0J357_9HYPO|nr:hypothetical protein E4U42_005830 [Claviceps africana]
MKFSSASILGAFSAASPELDIIVDVLRQVQQQVDNLGAVHAENGPAVAPMVDAFLRVVSTITSGIDTISRLDKLKFASSLLLASPVSELKEHTQVLSEHLLGAKPRIAAQGNTDVVYKQVVRTREATQSLISIIIDKVPSKAQGIARYQAQGIIDILQGLQETFLPDQQVL